tara:strand:+ start:61 stop:390 length:330 start_codon:yes stop_codon:yes gene_type:complete
MNIYKTRKELEEMGAVLVPGTPVNNDKVLEHILYHDTPAYRKILPCKECGNEYGVLIPGGDTSLAECSICQHLCDIKHIKNYSLKDYYPHLQNYPGADFLIPKNNTEDV